MEGAQQRVATTGLSALNGCPVQLEETPRKRARSVVNIDRAALKKGADDHGARRRRALSRSAQTRSAIDNSLPLFLSPGPRTARAV